MILQVLNMAKCIYILFILKDHDFPKMMSLLLLFEICHVGMVLHVFIDLLEALVYVWYLLGS
jgi:hypothetical protein